MLIPGTFTIDPRAVANYAHRIARRYASDTTPYRLAFMGHARGDPLRNGASVTSPLLTPMSLPSMTSRKRSRSEKPG